MIPAIVHQMWKTETIPARFERSPDSWRRFHPGWEFKLWTDASINQFVECHYPALWPTFADYSDQIQRVDAARYMILHHFGGLYSDLDIECLRSMDELRAHEVVLPETSPVGFSNDLMMTQAGHPLFDKLVSELIMSKQRWSRWYVPRHFRVMLTTGPLHLTRVARSFVSSKRVHVLSPAEYSSQLRDSAYVYHWPGDTWAGWDTHLFVFLHKRWKLILLALLIALAVVVMMQGTPAQVRD